MVRITIDELQRDVAGYLGRVESGETLQITRADRPVAEVKPVEPPTASLRPAGLCAGEFVAPDDFDEPLPEDIIRDFEGQ